ncbi:hypothetical protein HY990_05890 [Candidatus Micrarchaeota archaeon]|nr:hypothetical protein [Candidatus Micrarchaeota archaeon]
MKLNLKQASLSLGSVFGILHFVSALLITQTNGMMVNWWMSSHHLQIAPTIVSLNGFTLIFGTISATIIGTIIGGLFALVWNYFEGGDTNGR